MTDKIITLSGIRKEFKRIRWPSWLLKNRETQNEAAVLNTTLKVVLFVTFLAFFFVICDAATVGILKALSIGR